jgi:hypothetical protein
MRLKGEMRPEPELEALADETCRSLGYTDHNCGGIRMSVLMKAIRSNPMFREVFIV